MSVLAAVVNKSAFHLCRETVGASGKMELHLGPRQHEVQRVSDHNGHLLLLPQVSINGHCQHRGEDLHPDPTGRADKVSIL